MMKYLKTRRGLVLAALGALSIAAGLGVELRARAADSCCYPGAPCCHPGAACCKGHGGAQKHPGG